MHGAEVGKTRTNLASCFDFLLRHSLNFFPSDPHSHLVIVDTSLAMEQHYIS